MVLEFYRRGDTVFDGHAWHHPTNRGTAFATGGASPLALRRPLGYPRRA